jgi:hypothetical protein
MKAQAIANSPVSSNSPGLISDRTVIRFNVKNLVNFHIFSFTSKLLVHSNITEIKRERERRNERKQRETINVFLSA